MRWTPLLLLLACGEAPPPPGEESPPAPTGGDAAVTPPAEPEAELPRAVYLDLVAHADRGHVRRDGPVFGPHDPGWRRVTTLAGRGPWLEERWVDDRKGSWLEGIGGTIYFPVGPEGPDLRKVEFWLRPVGSGQRVSVFVDEVPLVTTRVRPGWRRYVFSLPGGGLEPGEHSLRFWFRFTRFIGKTRTPAAFARVRFLPDGAEAPPPEEWVGELHAGERGGPALLAGPPAAWSFHLVPPRGARLLADVAVDEGPPVEFVVRLEADGEPAEEARKLTVTPGAFAALDVDLSSYGERPVRLTLETTQKGGDSGGALPRAGWIRPRVTMPGRPVETLPTVRNVIVWAVDGLRADRVGLGRGGEHAATPNLDMLAAEGAAAVGVWSGGARPEDGHERLLRPFSVGSDVAALFEGAGRKTGLISSSLAIEPELARPFGTRLDLHRAGEPPETGIVMRELDDWLYVRARHPFFLYIASADPRAPGPASAGFRKMYERARPLRGDGRQRERQRKTRDLVAEYDAGVSAADYWVGQMVALLRVHEVADDTAIIVTGTVGRALREEGVVGDGHALSPELLQVPVVVWHPGLRAERPRGLVKGGDLTDVAALALSLAGVEPPGAWPVTDLGGPLFHGVDLAPRYSHARLKNQAAARFGDWLLRGIGSRDLRLYHLRTDRAAENDLSTERPIALRTLRDGMLDLP